MVKINTRILLVTFLWMISITNFPILATKWTQNSKFCGHFFSGKAQKVFIVFVSRRCLMKILKHIWDLYLINPIMIYWVWASFYWENQRHILLYRWQMWKLNPLSRVSLSRTGRTPEWRLSALPAKSMEYFEAQRSHSYLTFWFAGNGLAPTTTKYCHFNAFLMHSVRGEKHNLQCPKLKPHKITYGDLPFFNTSHKIPHWFQGIHRYIIYLWECYVCSVICY